MRKNKKLFAVLLSVMMVLCMMPAMAYADVDNTAPQIDISTLKIDKKIVNREEFVHLSVKIIDQSELLLPSVVYKCNAQDNGASVQLEYNPKSGLYEGDIVNEFLDYSDPEHPINKGFYGDYEIDVLSAEDVYGNETWIYNEKHYPDKGLNLSAGDFKVIGGIEEDHAGPIIDYENIIVDKKIESGKKAKIIIPITDASEIYNVIVQYGNEKSSNNRSQAFLYKNKDGNFEGNIELNSLGNNNLVFISALDANNYESRVYNSAYKFVDSMAGHNPAFNLKYADICYGSEGELSNEPQIDLASIRLSNLIINKNSDVKMTVKINSDNPINNVHAWYIDEKNTRQMYCDGRKIGDNYYEIYGLPNELYGKMQLAEIRATDCYGNEQFFVNQDLIPYSDDIPSTDLSIGDYYVGIIDPETGLAISDSEINDDTNLSVDETEQEGDLYEEMIDDDCLGVAFYEVKVIGDRDHCTRVSFVPPEGYKNGDKVRIRHKKNDNSIETFDAVVKNNRITIEVEEFSPFLLEISENHTHRMVKKDAPATCTKAGYKPYWKCSLCNNMFSDKAGQNEITKPSAVPALGHNYKRVTTKTATLTASGKTEMKCSRCGTVQRNTAKTIYYPKTISLSTTKYIYNGYIKTPSVTVKDTKGNTLTKDIDYTVRYASGRKNTGKYAVTVNFTGNYSGSKDLHFTIVPKATTAKLTLYGHDDVKVSWNKVIGASGYKVYYRKAGSSSWTTKGYYTGTYTTLKNLTDGRKYEVIVKPYKKIGDTRYYAPGTIYSIYTLKQVTTPSVYKYSSSKVKVKWSNIYGESGYQISKSTRKTGTNIVYTYGTTSGTYKTISATKGKTYYYKVRAYKTVDGKRIYDLGHM